MRVVIVAVLLIVGMAAHAQQPRMLYVDPACPKPNEHIALMAVSQIPYGSAQAEVTGNVIRLVVTYPILFAEPVRYSARTTVGPLPIGSYRVDLYRRVGTPGGTPGPEALLMSQQFDVQENPPACEARRIVAQSTELISGVIGQPYTKPLAVEVLDAHGLRVPNATVHFQRVARPEEFFDGSAKPDFAAAPAAPPGTHTFNATANSVPGTFQYRVWIDYANEQPATYFVISNRSEPGDVALQPVVEYRNAVLNHYFMTRYPNEMEKLDSGEARGWERTGGVFLAFGAGGSRPAAASGVCRFYGTPEAGLNSHFFTVSADECDAVRQRFGDAWLLETGDAFGAILPDVQTGACPGGTRPLYRAYNNEPDANHRYSLAPSVLTHTLRRDSASWVREGYGPDAVAMCVPQ